MIQQFHSWAYIWRKHQFKRIPAPELHSSAIHNNQDTEAT